MIGEKYLMKPVGYILKLLRKIYGKDNFLQIIIMVMSMMEEIGLDEKKTMASINEAYVLAGGDPLIPDPKPHS